MSLFQSESKCETIMKMTDLHENKTECRTHFQMNGFALRLVLKQAQENSEMGYWQQCTSEHAQSGRKDARPKF